MFCLIDHHRWIKKPLSEKACGLFRQLFYMVAAQSGYADPLPGVELQQRLGQLVRVVADMAVLD